LSVFNNVSLDGYFVDADGNMSWAHDGSNDPEFAAFTAGNASSEGALIFGRVTYEMMVQFWPTEAASAVMPEVAAGMNRMDKIVFSRTLGSSDWQNTRIIHDDPVSAMRRLKQEIGPHLTILGSGTIVAQLAAAGLVDEYRLIICPVVLGRGRTMFEGMKKPIGLARTSVRVFDNGKIHACYEPT
jgi:dihydrofolate reductase